MAIKDILQAASLTHRAMADDLGIPLVTIDQWASGKRKPPEYLVRLIAEHYGVTEYDVSVVDSILACNPGMDPDSEEGRQAISDYKEELAHIREGVSEAAGTV